MPLLVGRDDSGSTCYCRRSAHLVPPPLPPLLPIIRFPNLKQASGPTLAHRDARLSNNANYCDLPPRRE